MKPESWLELAVNAGSFSTEEAAHLMDDLRNIGGWGCELSSSLFLERAISVLSDAASVRSLMKVLPCLETLPAFRIYENALRGRLHVTFDILDEQNAVVDEAVLSRWRGKCESLVGDYGEAHRLFSASCGSQQDDEVIALCCSYCNIERIEEALALLHRHEFTDELAAGHARTLVEKLRGTTFLSISPPSGMAWWIPAVRYIPRREITQELCSCINDLSVGGYLDADDAKRLLKVEGAFHEHLGRKFELLIVAIVIELWETAGSESMTCFMPLQVRLLRWAPYMLATVYLQMKISRADGRTEQGLQFALEAHKAGVVDFPYLWWWLGKAYQELRDDVQALSYFDEYYRFEPDNPELCLRLGQVLHSMGRTREALPYIVLASYLEGTQDAAGIILSEMGYEDSVVARPRRG